MLSGRYETYVFSMPVTCSITFLDFACGFQGAKPRGRVVLRWRSRLGSGAPSSREVTRGKDGAISRTSISPVWGRRRGRPTLRGRGPNRIPARRRGRSLRGVGDRGSPAPSRFRGEAPARPGASGGRRLHLGGRLADGARERERRLRVHVP